MQQTRDAAWIANQPSDKLWFMLLGHLQDATVKVDRHEGRREVLPGLEVALNVARELRMRGYQQRLGTWLVEIPVEHSPSPREE